MHGCRLRSRTVTTHRCLTCSPGPAQVLDHERAIVHVPRGFRGPPQSVHGGAAAGLVACLGDAHLIAPTARFNVRLHAPPPLLTELAYTVDVAPDRQSLRFSIGEPGAPVLSGWASTEAAAQAAEPVVPPEILADLASHASLSPQERGRFNNPPPDNGSQDFNECYGCGSDNADGLHLKTRPIDDQRAWIDWTPEPRWYDGDSLGTLAAIAALDCTSAVPLRHLGITAETETCLLGTYDGQIHRRPAASIGGSFRIVTAPRYRDGRKIYADIGLFSPAGEVFISGCATWIVLAS